jgi:hypothetical protein
VDADLHERLEMLLVLQWLDEDRPSDGAVALSVTTAAAELALPAGREGLLAVMGALGELEERGVVAVTWPGGPGRDAHVRLGDALRADADRLFGGR